MNIRTRLTALLLTGAVAIFALGGYASWQSRQMADSLGLTLQETIAQTRLQEAVLQAQVSFKTQVQEWKNILVRGNDKASFDKYLKQFGDEKQKSINALERTVSGMQAAGLDPAPARKAIDELHTLDQRYRAALQNFDPADPETGKKVDLAVKGMDRPLTEALGVLETHIAGFVADQAEQHTEKSNAVARQATVVMMGGALVLLLALGVAGVFILRSIMRPLVQLRQTMHRAEQDWDLTLRAVVTRDEVGECGEALNAMFDRFQSVVRDIHQRADALSARSAMIAGHMANISNATAGQSSSASAIAAAVEEMSVSVGQVSEAANESQKLAHASRSGAENGSQAVTHGNTQLDQVAGRVNDTANVLNELGERSKAVAGIVQTVKEIADQTNLLALNAAIEAARAGDQGRGFAVVADEVRNLAEGTTRSTEQINSVVRMIQESASNAISDIQRVVQDVANQLIYARQAAESIEDIGHAATLTLEASERIAMALREQGSASQEIAGQIENIARSSEDNSRVAGEVVGDTRELNELASELLSAVKRFRA